MAKPIPVIISILCYWGLFLQSCECGENTVCISYKEDLERGHEEMLETAEYNVITKTIVLNDGTPEEARKNIKQYFQDTFDLDTSLFDHIRTEVHNT